MSRSWYAETMAWASVSKEKREKRKRRRAAHGPYAARGKSSQIHKDVQNAKLLADINETAQMAKMLGVPKSTSREPSPPNEKAEE